MPTNRRHDEAHRLSAMQRHVTYGMAMGWSVRQIAAWRGIAYHTARTHIEIVQRKLGLHSMHEVCAWAWRSGWMEAEIRCRYGGEL